MVRLYFPLWIFKIFKIIKFLQQWFENFHNNGDFLHCYGKILFSPFAIVRIIFSLCYGKILFSPLLWLDFIFSASYLSIAMVRFYFLRLLPPLLWLDFIFFLCYVFSKFSK